MPSEAHSDEYYTCRVVSNLFNNNDERQAFMAAYNEGPQAAENYLVNTQGMPQDMAAKVVSLQGDELNSFIGQNVCNYLW